MIRSTRAIVQFAAVAAAALLLACGLVFAQPPPAPASAAAAGPAAVALPQPGEDNGARAISQPGNNAPMWREVRGAVAGATTLPGLEKGVLIQPLVQYPGTRVTTAGEAWRELRNRWLIPYGGALFVITLLALAAFYLKRGAIGGRHPDTGRLIERFTYFERAAHWSVAGSFVILAVSGLVMAFGKFLLLPVMGGLLFGWLSVALKTLHNFVGPLFAVALAVVLVTFVRDNLPRAGDLRWLLRLGGMVGGEEIASHRFNAGEKVVYWVGVFVLGIAAVGSGLVLDQLIPGVQPTRGNMQVAHIVHDVATLLMMALFLLHIYMGTVGMRGALAAMKTGSVDEAWAREHHALWCDDIEAGRIPAWRSMAADAEGGAAPVAPQNPAPT